MSSLFDFGKYGTFSGPGIPTSYTFDDSEPNWWKLNDFGADFNLNDVAMVLLNTKSDYVYLKLNGSSTNTVTLGKSIDKIHTFNVDAQTTNFNGNINVIAPHEITAQTINATNFIGTINVQSWKLFDIPHPNKPNKRLRHACIEGPEVAVYIRGRLKNSNVINLPDYWQNLVDPESISVQLTQIGCSQDLIVERLNWGKQIIIKSGNGVNIDCYYTITAKRIDVPDLEVEYEGTEIKTPETKRL
jgi:hypothetical protein